MPNNINLVPKGFKVEKAVFPSRCAEMLGIDVGLVCAVKRRAGMERRKVFPSQVERFLKDNPDFTAAKEYRKN